MVGLSDIDGAQKPSRKNIFFRNLAPVSTRSKTSEVEDMVSYRRGAPPRAGSNRGNKKFSSYTSAPAVSPSAERAFKRPRVESFDNAQTDESSFSGKQIEMKVPKFCNLQSGSIRKCSEAGSVRGISQSSSSTRAPSSCDSLSGSSSQKVCQIQRSCRSGRRCAYPQSSPSRKTDLCIPPPIDPSVFEYHSSSEGSRDSDFHNDSESNSENNSDSESSRSSDDDSGNSDKLNNSEDDSDVSDDDDSTSRVNDMVFNHLLKPDDDEHLLCSQRSSLRPPPSLRKLSPSSSLSSNPSVRSSVLNHSLVSSSVSRQDSTRINEEPEGSPPPSSSSLPFSVNRFRSSVSPSSHRTPVPPCSTPDPPCSTPDPPCSAPGSHPIPLRFSPNLNNTVSSPMRRLISNVAPSLFPNQSHGKSNHHHVKSTDNDLSDTCAICLIDLPKNDESIGRLPVCPHVFCYDCILRWSDVSNRCPLCKTRFHKIQRKLRSPDGKLNVVDVPIEDKDPTDLNDTDLETEYHCQICNSGEREDVLLLCDGCDDAYHTYCIGLQAIPEGQWFCQFCAPPPVGPRGQRMRELIERIERENPTLERLRRPTTTETRRNRRSTTAMNRDREWEPPHVVLDDDEDSLDNSVRPIMRRCLGRRSNQRSDSSDDEPILSNRRTTRGQSRRGRNGSRRRGRLRRPTTRRESESGNNGVTTRNISNSISDDDSVIIDEEREWSVMATTEAGVVDATMTAEIATATTVPEATTTLAEAPTTLAEAPATLADATATVPEATRTLAEATTTLAEAPTMLAEAPTMLAEATTTLAEATTRRVKLRSLSPCNSLMNGRRNKRPRVSESSPSLVQTKSFIQSFTPVVDLEDEENTELLEGETRLSEREGLGEASTSTNQELLCQSSAHNASQDDGLQNGLEEEELQDERVDCSRRIPYLETFNRSRKRLQSIKSTSTFNRNNRNFLGNSSEHWLDLAKSGRKPSR